MSTNTLFAAVVNGGIASGLTVALIWLILRLVPRRMLNASTRYAIWWLAMAMTLAMPALFLYTPEPVPAPVEESARLPAIDESFSTSAPAMTPQPPRNLKHTTVSHPSPSMRLPSLPFRFPDAMWPRTILILWAGFSFLCLARVVISYLLLKRLESRATQPPSAMLARFESWMTWANLQRRGIRIATSSEIGVPVAVGPWRPSILIPDNLCEQLQGAEMEQIGLHEAAHLVRRDDWALVAQRIVEAAFFLHPVVRCIARNIDLEREIACDDLVVAATGRPASYANCLVRVVELSIGIRASLTAATAGEDNSHLAHRIDALLDRARSDKTSLAKTRLTLIAGIMIVSAVLAGQVSGFVAFAMPPGSRVSRPVVLIPAKVIIAPLQAVTSGQNPNLAGRVLEDSTGNPVASAELRFRREGMRELAADIETDRQGRFVAPDLPPGEYAIEVRKANFINTAFRLQLPSGSPTVRLVRWGVIDGRVTDERGSPLPGRVLEAGGRSSGYTRVVVLVKSPGSDDMRIFREAEIADGHYRVYDLPPGEYQIGVWYNNLSVGSGMQLFPDSAHPRVFTVLGGEEYTNINFTATSKPAWEVSGRVLLPPGLKGQFQMALGLPDQRTLPVASTLSADDGTFRFSKVPAGVYQLFASGPTGGYGAYESTLGRGEPLFGRMQIQVAGGNLEEVQVPVNKGGTLKVVLKAAGSDRVPEGCPQATRVTPQPLDPWALLYFGTAQATFGKEQSIANLPPGRARLTARELGPTCFQTNQPIVEVSGDSETPVAVEVDSAGSIKGSLKNSGPGVFGIVLVASGAVDNSSALLAYPAPDGRFRFDSIPPGDYLIAAQPVADSKARWVSKNKNAVEIHVKGGVATNIDLSPAGGSR